MMIRNTLFTVLALMAAVQAQAKEYLGFDLGGMTFEQAQEKLNKEGAAYEDDWSYKGSSELPSIKLLSVPTMSKHGMMKEGWLSFTTNRKLHQILVIYADAGDTFKVLKDALDSKYGQPKVGGFGFQSEYTYRDGPTVIKLGRNTFGFGAEQTTTLTYRYTPYDAEVEASKAKVEAAIRRANAQKAGGDL